MKLTVNFIKKSIVFILSFCMFIGAPSTIFAEETKKKDEIKVKSSILMCMDTGDVIKENNAYEHLSPASVTKIMSILLIMEAIDSGKIKLDDMVTAGENAVSKGGSQIWLEVGEQMSVNDLLKAVIISSANDACTLLGEYVAGSDTAFVDMMNQKAAELGCTGTHFSNPHGLDDEAHYTTAQDMALITRYALSLPDFREYLVEDILQRTYQDVAADSHTSVEQQKKEGSYFPKASWFHRESEYYQDLLGEYQLMDGAITLTTHSPNGSVDYEGTVLTDKLRLSSHSNINGYEVKGSEYVFYSFDELSD